MYTRRRFLATSAIAAAGIGLAACRDAAQAQPSTAGTSGAIGPLNTRAIPSTGEKIPVIGMGTSGSFVAALALAWRSGFSLEQSARAGAAAANICMKSRESVNHRLSLQRLTKEMERLHQQ